MDDLAQLLESSKSNISVVAFPGFSPWQFMESTQDENFKKVYEHMTGSFDFNYDEISKGRQIAIQYDVIFESIINANKHAGLHLSGDRYFGSALCILYSKAINNRIKKKIDSAVYNVYETGLQGLWSSLAFHSGS